MGVVQRCWGVRECNLRNCISWKPHAFSRQFGNNRRVAWGPPGKEGDRVKLASQRTGETKRIGRQTICSHSSYTPSQGTRKWADGEEGRRRYSPEDWVGYGIIYYYSHWDGYIFTGNRKDEEVKTTMAQQRKHNKRRKAVGHVGRSTIDLWSTLRVPSAIRFVTLGGTLSIGILGRFGRGRGWCWQEGDYL